MSWRGLMRSPARTLRLEAAAGERLAAQRELCAAVDEFVSPEVVDAHASVMGARFGAVSENAGLLVANELL